MCRLENAASWMSLGILMLWLLSITGPNGYIGPSGFDTNIEVSWIYTIGAFISPVFSPMGWDVRLIVALVLGVVAKEIVIGSLGLIYGLSSSGILLETVLQQEFNFFSAYAFMVFVLLYTPCIGTYFTMKQEIGKRWTNFSVFLSLILAYLFALLIGRIPLFF